jgi:hypothetical protein
MALQPDRSHQADPHHRPPGFGPRGEDPPLSSPSRLIHEHIFTAPVTSRNSDLRAIASFLDTWPAALGAIGPNPDLMALFDTTRAGQPASARTPTGSTSTSAEMRAIFFGRYGWPFSVLCWALVVVTYGIALLAAWVVAYVRVRHAATAQPTPADEAVEVRRVRVAQHWTGTTCRATRARHEHDANHQVPSRHH